MRRRTYIASCTVVTGLAGCTGLLGGGNDRDDPEAVVREFIAALDEGDRETANELIHEDSPQGELSEEQAGQTGELDLTVEGTELLQETDDTARVRVELTVSDGSERQTTELTYELRTEDGEWKIWDESAAGTPASELPQAAITFESDAEANTITVTLVSNQNADYVQATVDADDAPGWDEDGRLETVGESDTFHAGSDGSYRVTVRGYNGDRSAVLQRMTVDL